MSTAEPLPGFHIGADAAMFGVDYPHFESFVPHTLDKVTVLAGHPNVTEEDSAKILYENAAKLYGFDVGRLQPHVERVGFELESLLTPTPG